MMRRRKQEEKFEKMKRKIDAKARTTIRNSIDAKAFERSTYDCNTAYELTLDSIETNRGIYRGRDTQSTW